MKPDNLRILITNLLLAFVLVSIGFALGKHSVKDNNHSSPPTLNTTAEPFVKIYYMHATFRCVTCNSIEARARQLIEREFSEAWSQKKISWEEVNFQENEQLAKKFDVVASCVVVAVVRGGEILDFQRLDQVWPLLDKPAEFDEYVRAAVSKAITASEGKK